MSTKRGTSGGECYGEYSGGTGSGAGYVNSCIHSGSNDYTSGNTVWYNYATATAGTIKNSSSTDTTGTIVVATESVCPKGWTLPNLRESQRIGGEVDTYVSVFNPVLGGNYVNGVLSNIPNNGFWWSSEAYNGATRYFLYYKSSNNILGVGYNTYRRSGLYIRCVSEEKDVSDLTYMQDMTPSLLPP